MKLLYVTFPNKKTAENISLQLLKRRLIACANIFSIKSLFRWKGKLVKESEVASILKTTQNKVQQLLKALHKLHPYETPCIILLEGKPNKEYFSWVQQECA